MKKQQELLMRLDMLMPIKWLLDFSKQERRDVKDILTQVVQANKEWVEEVVKDFGFTEHKLTDVLHDFRGIYSEDEHFLPRIQAEEFNCEMCSKSMDEKEHDFSDICDDCREQDDSEDIIGDFDENGDAVDVKKYQSDEWVDAQRDAEDGKSIMDEFDVKVNGYTNIETYRLCLVLDNTEYWKEDILQTFFRLVREGEFSANDINIIDWNEVIKRYSDDLIETHIHHHNE